MAIPFAASDLTATAVETGTVQVVSGGSDLESQHATVLEAVESEVPAEHLTVEGEGLDDPAAGGEGAGTGAAEFVGAESESEGVVIALPLVYKDTEYGVLTLYATTDAIDDRELAVLETLARVASTAINAVEGRRILSTDRVVELEFSVAEEGLFYRDIATMLDCSLQYQGSVEGGGRVGHHAVRGPGGSACRGRSGGQVPQRCRGRHPPERPG